MNSKQPPNFDSMRKNFVPPKINVATGFRKLTTKEVTPNVMEQMISYNEKSTTFFLQQLSEEINDQKEMNRLLTNKDFDDNIQAINAFVEQNSEHVPEQTDNLEKLFKELKHIVNENNDLKEDQQEYKELLQTEEVVKISNDMVKLKSLKNDIILFLQSNGIRM